MSYLNNQLGYRDELLQTRSVVKTNNWVLLEPDGLVKNSIPGYVNCDVTILGSPAMGASFADYLVTGGEGIETFLYVIDGEIVVKNADKEAVLTQGGYIYSPEDKPVSFENKSGKDTKMYLYRRRYEKVEGYSAYTIVGNANELEWLSYEGMENCYVQNFLPTNDFGFDI